MSLIQKTSLLLVLFAPAARLQAGAQQADPFASAPTCVEQGITRFALSVPPDRSREDIVAALSRGEILPGGSEAFIFPDGAGPRLLNGEDLRDDARRTIGRIISRLKVDGKMNVLLTIDVDGKVTEATANSGNRELDRLMGTLWRKAQFAPVLVGGCRVETYFHLPVAFVSDFSLSRREMQMRIGASANATPDP